MVQKRLLLLLIIFANNQALPSPQKNFRIDTLKNKEWLYEIEAPTHLSSPCRHSFHLKTPQTLTEEDVLTPGSRPDMMTKILLRKNPDYLHELQYQCFRLIEEYSKNKQLVTFINKIILKWLDNQKIVENKLASELVFQISILEKSLATNPTHRNLIKGATFIKELIIFNHTPRCLRKLFESFIEISNLIQKHDDEFEDFFTPDPEETIVKWEVTEKDVLSAKNMCLYEIFTPKENPTETWAAIIKMLLIFNVSHHCLHELKKRNSQP